MYYLKRITTKQSHWHWFNRVNQTAATNLHLWIIEQPEVLSVIYSSESNTAYCVIEFESIDNRDRFEIELHANTYNITRTNYHSTAGTIDTYERGEL
jgi:hypothetical protein